MAWTYLTGVQENFTSTVITGPSNDTQTNINEIPCGAVRMIWAFNEQAQAKTHCQMIRNQGKTPIPTLDFDSTIVTQSGFITACQQYAAALEGIVPMIEIGNEPQAGREWFADGTGPFFDRIRDACNAPNSFQDKGIQVVMGTAPLGTNKDKAQLTAANLNLPGAPNTIYELIDGITLHPYSTTPGNASSPLSTSNPGEGTQLGWVWNRRKQLDAFGAAGAAQEIWITEFGWGNEAPGGAPPNLLTEPQTGTTAAAKAAREVDLQTKMTQAYTNWATHCEELKLRAACWYWLRDCTSTQCVNMQVVFRNCGLRTVGPGWHWKNGGGIKTALDSFGTGVTTGGALPPTVTTLAPPNPLGQTTATLRGTTDPEGLSTQYHYEYSTNPLPIVTPPSLGYAIANTGGVLKEDKPTTSAVDTVWNNYNPGPLSRWTYFTSGGDPHPQVNGTVHPNYRKVTLVDGDGDPNPGSPGDEERQQVGGAGPVVRFFQGYEGDHIIMYWSCRVPNLTITGGDSSMLWEFQNQSRSGSPPISFDQVAGNELQLGWKYTPSASRVAVWQNAVPVNTWLRFAVEIRFSTNTSLGRMRLWGNLADTGDLDLAPLTSLLTGHATLYPESPEDSSGLVFGIYQDDQIAGHAVDYAGIQICQYVP